MAHKPRVDAEPPDPDRAHTQQEFSHELTLARREAGLTVRQVAKASEMPVSTVGDYFAGRHLPTAGQPEMLPKILTALGIVDAAQVDGWLLALGRVRRPPGRRPGRGTSPGGAPHGGAPHGGEAARRGVSDGGSHGSAPHRTAPYRGLASFQPDDAAWFFGREELTLHLVRLATGVAATGLPLTVVGPSGSGKSSLLRAGLYPRLTAGPPGKQQPGKQPPGSQQPRPVLLITPGAAPVAALAAALAPVTGHGQAGPRDPAGFAAELRDEPERCAELVGRAGESAPAIIVDQFEEVFTACEDEAERQAFVAALTALSVTTLVVLGLRADYYASALRYPDLAASLQDRQIVVGPMSAGQLRRAIVEPAHKAGLDLEDGLVELLLRDVRPRVPGGAGTAGHEVGALPLLSHALLATWERAAGNRLTVADYQASGGIRDAIARTAEAAYGQLSDSARDVARQLFLRLVHVAEGARETRARVSLSELPGQPGDEGDTVPGVLEQFIAQRLVTVDASTAEITHEALLDAWPRLRTWLDANAEDVRIWRFVGPAAQVWASTGRDPAALLRGGQLALARDWSRSPAHRQGVSPLAREFVDAGLAEEKAQQAAQRRHTAVLRRLVAALTVLVLVTVGLTAYAFQQRHLAAQARDVALANRNAADSRAVAVEADQARPLDPALAGQLALAAYRDVRTSTALASLLEASAAPAAARLHDSTGLVQSVAVSPSHRLLAAAGADGTLRLWDVAVPAHPVPLRRLLRLGNARSLYAAAFSHNGQVLAAGGRDRLVRLWDVADPARPRRLTAPLAGPAGTIYALAFSPDDHLLAVGSSDGTVRLWDVSDPAHPVALSSVLADKKGYVQAVAFSPDGRLLAAGSTDGDVRLWRVGDPSLPRQAGAALAGPRDPVDAVAFSPDGRDLAAGSLDHQVWRWDVTSPWRPRPLPTLTGATDWVNAVSFSPDGSLLAAGSSDDEVMVWNAATGAPVAALPHPQPVTSLAWDGPGLLVTGDADGYARIWRVPPPELETGSAVNSVAVTPAGLLVAGGQDLQLWNPATRRQMAAAPVPAGHSVTVNSVAASPATGGSPGAGLIATGYSNGTLQLWRDGAGLTPLGTPQVASTSAPGSSNQVEFVAFRRDATVLATGADDGTVRLWDVSHPAQPRWLATIPDVTNQYVYSVTFSPGGQILAGGVTDGSVWLWRVSRPSHPTPIATLTGPAGHVFSIAFGPGGRTLTAGSSDGSVWRWDTAPGQAAAGICAMAGQPLTRAQWHTYFPGRPYSPPCPRG